MNLSIRCHGCNHSFQRTAAQVLADDRCPHCSSRDIDLDESEARTAAETKWCRRCGSVEATMPSGMCGFCHNRTNGVWAGPDAKQSALGEPERGLCPRCNTAQLSVATGTCSQCGYEVMNEQEVVAVDWLLELRRLQSEEGLSFDDAKARLGSRLALAQARLSALTEPNDAPGSQQCPGCSTANYDGSTCSNCGYTPEDYTKDSSRKTAYETHCPDCGQEGCSPNCPGPSSRGTCPDCGAGTSDGKCNDPQGCGWGWASGDRGLTSDGEPRYVYAAKVNTITADVLASNPGMEHKTAQAIAIETLRRYPVVAKRR